LNGLSFLIIVMPFETTESGAGTVTALRTNIPQDDQMR